MFPYLILGVSLFLGLLLMGNWYANTDPKKVLKAAKWALGTLLLLLAAWLLLSGRLWQGLVALGGLVPLLMRWGLPLLRFAPFISAARQRWKASRGPSPGGESGVNTATLAMFLDHESGHLGGEVRRGRFAGRSLDDLDFDSLCEILRDCAADDPESVPVLEAYLDRREGPDWRERFHDGNPGGGRAHDQQPRTRDGAMTREEALAVLGLDDGADEKAIREAHRRMMLANHPDKGGSDYLAAKINEAKDKLLDGH